MSWLQSAILAGILSKDSVATSCQYDTQLGEASNVVTDVPVPAHSQVWH